MYRRGLDLDQRFTGTGLAGFDVSEFDRFNRGTVASIGGREHARSLAAGVAPPYRNCSRAYRTGQVRRGGGFAARYNIGSRRGTTTCICN